MPWASKQCVAKLQHMQHVLRFRAHSAPADACSATRAAPRRSHKPASQHLTARPHREHRCRKQHGGRLEVAQEQPAPKARCGRTGMGGQGGEGIHTHWSSASCHHVTQLQCPMTRMTHGAHAPRTHLHYICADEARTPFSRQLAAPRERGPCTPLPSTPTWATCRPTCPVGASDCT